MPKKEKKDFEKEETSLDAEETIIKKKEKKSKKVSFNEVELQEKFVKVFNATAYFLKVEAKYTEKDFETEAKELVRLTAKTPFLASLLAILDPIFLVIGLLTKIIDIAKKVKSRKDAEALEEARSEEDGGDKTSEPRTTHNILWHDRERKNLSG